MDTAAVRVLDWSNNTATKTVGSWGHSLHFVIITQQLKERDTIGYFFLFHLSSTQAVQMNRNFKEITDYLLLNFNMKWNYNEKEKELQHVWWFAAAAVVSCLRRRLETGTFWFGALTVWGILHNQSPEGCSGVQWCARTHTHTHTGLGLIYVSLELNWQTVGFGLC